MIDWSVVIGTIGLLITTGGIIFATGRYTERISGQIQNLANAQKSIISTQNEMNIVLTNHMSHLIQDVEDIREELIKKGLL